MKKRLLALALLSTVLPLFAVTIRLETDSVSYNKLTPAEKEYFSLAQNDFKNNLLLCNEVNIRTDEVDSRIRELQKKTQIEASQGMGSDYSALNIDQGSKIDLALVFRMTKNGSSYFFSYDLTETERMNSIGGESSTAFTLDDLDTELRTLSLKVLKKLRDRSYIKNLDPALELELMKSATAKAQEARLQKQMAEKSTMTAESYARFQDEIARIEKQRSSIIKDSANAFTLKQRIALIESVREDRKRIYDAVQEMNRYIEDTYTTEANSQIREINNRAWRTAETDEYGNPTAKAKSYRDREIADIRSKYQKLITQEQEKVNQSQEGTLKEYDNRLAQLTKELCAKPYVFRSIDDREDYLETTVGKFDGTKQAWTVRSQLNIYDIYQVDNRVVALPPMEIKDTFIMGTRPQENNYAAYQKYLDDIETADLYFRTSTPYIYSELTVDISYNASRGTYELTFNDYRIYKTETRQMIYHLDKKSATAYGNKTVTTESDNTSGSSGSNNTKDIVKSVANSVSNAYEKSQRGRNGLYFDIGAMAGDDFVGINTQGTVSIGGRHLFVGLFGDISTDMDSYYRYDKSFLDVGGLMGYAWNLFFLRIYGWTGVGFMTFTETSSYYYDLGGLITRSKVGADLVLGAYNLGVYAGFNASTILEPTAELGFSVGLVF